MSSVHEVVGFVVVGVFTIGWIWGLGAWISKRGPGERYWVWLAVAQVVAGVQAVLGITLLIMGRRMTTPGAALGGVLHYVYGLLPLLLFVFAHIVARAGNAKLIGIDRPVRPWVPFAWVSFICFGLTSRAVKTGLGLG
ncbi:MAG: hypothetical protein ACM3WR_03840 [Solirubrobacterales bacterium]